MPKAATKTQKQDKTLHLSSKARSALRKRLARWKVAHKKKMQQQKMMETKRKEAMRARVRAECKRSTSTNTAAAAAKSAARRAKKAGAPPKMALRGFGGKRKKFDFEDDL